MANGFGNLADLLTGGGKAGQQNAFYTGQMQQGQVSHLSAQTEQALASAKVEQQKAKAAARANDANNNLADDFLASGLAKTPEEAAAYAHLALGGHGTFETLAKGRGELQTQGFRNTIANPNAAPDVRLGASMGISGKPESPLVAAPQENVNAFVPNTAAAPTVNQTPLGKANTEKALRPPTNLVDPAAVAAAAALIAQGRAPLPTGRSMVTGPGAAIVKAVVDQNPDFNANTYPTQAAAEKDFTSGMTSRKVNSLNTAIAHMQTLDELAGALGNDRIRKFNEVRQYLAKETGRAAPTNFKEAADLVGQEVVAAVVANNGTKEERDRAANAFANIASPEQLKGATDTYRTLLGGQMDSLANKYKVGTGREDFHKRFLTVKTRTALGLDKSDSSSGTKPPAASDAVVKWGRDASGKPVRIQ